MPAWVVLIPGCVVLFVASCGAIYALYQLFGPILDDATDHHHESDD